MDIAVDEKTSLQIRRTLPVPVAAVYTAWTDPAQVKCWMASNETFLFTRMWRKLC